MYCTCHFEMLDYNFIEFVIISSLHFVCHYLFGGRFKKEKDIGFINLRIVWAKINNSFKILRNKPNIIILHS